MVQTRYLVIQNHPEIKDHDFTQVEELWEKNINNSVPLLLLGGAKSGKQSDLNDGYDHCHGKNLVKRRQFNETTRRRIDL